jgi:hypothetical protein
MDKKENIKKELKKKLLELNNKNISIDDDELT